MSDNQPFEGIEDDFEIDLGAEPEAEASDDVDLNLDFGDADDEGGLSEADLLASLGGGDDEDADEESAADAAPDEEAILEDLRLRLRGQEGDWYVIHTYSGMENRVKQNLDARVITLGMEDFIFESIVPTEDAVEIRNGAKKVVTRTILPGYVLVRMELTDESWAAVRHTPSVTGFVAHANAPVPLSIDEVVKMLAPAELSKAAAASQTKAPVAKKKIEVADFKVGDSVMVVQGPFSGVHASITEINANSQRLKALVEILGRETPVDLTFSQVQKDD